MLSSSLALPLREADLVTGTGDRAQRIKAIVGASSGNLVEWFDFYTYAFTSIYFAAAFFPTGDATSQLMATAGIFAVGFFMRPLGGWLFGMDRRQAWTQELNADFRTDDVRWLADDRRAAHLRDHRRGCARTPSGGAPDSRPVGRG